MPGIRTSITNDVGPIELGPERIASAPSRGLGDHVEVGLGVGASIARPARISGLVIGDRSTLISQIVDRRPLSS